MLYSFKKEECFKSKIMQVTHKVHHSFVSNSTFCKPFVQIIFSELCATDKKRKLLLMVVIPGL